MASNSERCYSARAYPQDVVWYSSWKRFRLVGSARYGGRAQLQGVNSTLRGDSFDSLAGAVVWEGLNCKVLAAFFVGTVSTGGQSVREGAQDVNRCTSDQVGKAAGPLNQGTTTIFTLSRDPGACPPSSPFRPLPGPRLSYPLGAGTRHLPLQAAELHIAVVTELTV